MKPLMTEVRKLVTADPSVTNQQIYDELKLKFPNDNPSWLRQHIVQYRNFILRRKGTPLENSPVLLGTWRHSNGMIYCGTLCIAKGYFDINPNPDFCARVFDDICRTMNETQQ